MKYAKIKLIENGQIISENDKFDKKKKFLEAYKYLYHVHAPDVLFLQIYKNTFKNLLNPFDTDWI